MWLRRLVYLTVLTGCLVFFLFYKEWLSWLLLVTVAVLPWLSLLLSLPAMRSVTVGLRCPTKVRQDMPVRTALQLDCAYPPPPVNCKIRLHNLLTDQRYTGHPGERVPTHRCGAMAISYDRLRIYDYLGLFCKKKDYADACVLYIEPKPLPAVAQPNKANAVANRWQPKPGGGFSEEHDLRLYRPGDPLKQIHWKISAKVGKLIFREPIEPVLQGYGMTLSLSGTPEQMERKLGRLVGLGESLLGQGLSYCVSCATGSGTLEFQVKDRLEQEQMLQTLLRSKPAQTDRVSRKEGLLWQQKIGGDGGEE